MVRTTETLPQEGEEDRRRGKLPVSDAERRAGATIRQLQRIRGDDPNAHTELDQVVQWVTEKEITHGNGTAEPGVGVHG